MSRYDDQTWDHDIYPDLNGAGWIRLTPAERAAWKSSPLTQRLEKAVEKRIEMINYETRPARRRHKAPEGECEFCDRMRHKNEEYHPPHDASKMCASGSRDHCTCDGCF
jgi:hypothetical protein